MTPCDTFNEFDAFDHWGGEGARRRHILLTLASAGGHGLSRDRQEGGGRGETTMVNIQRQGGGDSGGECKDYCLVAGT